MATQYLKYRAHDLKMARLSSLREIARLWEIPGWDTQTMAGLRHAILNSPKNLSPVPHPLIDLPVEHPL